MITPTTRTARSAPWIVLGLLTAFWAVPAGSAAAQTVDDARAVTAFRDSIAGIADTARLRALESRLLVAAKTERANPRVHLSLGYLALALGDHTDAVSEFKWATELAPQWPAAWYAWGEAELALGDEVTSAATARQLLMARDAWSRAAHAFARAVQLDTSYIAVEIDAAGRALDAGRADWARVLGDGMRRGGVGSRRPVGAPGYGARSDAPPGG